MLVNASTFAFYACAIRSLGVAAGGLLLSLLALALMIAAPFSVAALALSSTAARHFARHNLDRVASLASWTFTGTIGLLALAAAAAAVLSPVISAFLGGGTRLTAVATAAVFSLTAALYLFRGLIQGIGDYDGLAISNGAETLARLALSAALLHATASIGDALRGLTIALAVSFVATAARLLAKTGIRFASVSSGGTGQSSLPTFVTMGSLTILTFFDAVVARHFLSPIQSGLYNAAALAGRALMTLLAFAPAVVMPKLSAARERGDDLREMSREALFFALGVCVPSALVFWFAPSLVVRLIAGSHFAGASYLVGRYGLAASALAGAIIICSLRLARGDKSIAPIIATVAAAEMAGLLAFHTSADVLVSVVLAGHGAALLVAAATPRSRLLDEDSFARAEQRIEC